MVARCETNDDRSFRREDIDSLAGANRHARGRTDRSIVPVLVHQPLNKIGETHAENLPANRLVPHENIHQPQRTGDPRKRYI